MNLSELIKPHQYRTLLLIFSLFLLMLSVITSAMSTLSAQEPTGVPTFSSQPTQAPITPAEEERACPVTVSRSEPSQITGGEARVLTVFGSGFSETSAVRLSGFGVLTTTLVNSGVLNADIPETVPPGTYNVRVVDPTCEDVLHERPERLTLNVLAPQLPPPTFVPIDTLEPPTPMPGAPQLIARNFAVNPPMIDAGGTVQMSFEVYNQGNRTAEGVSAAIEAGGVFLPAGGQAATILPNLPPGGTATVNLAAVVTEAAEAGPASIPVVISYRDFSGESYTAETALSVTVRAVVNTSQVVLTNYTYSPNPVVPGADITLMMTFTNRGNTVAQQTLLRVTGEGVLLPGVQGDNFPLMDLQPGASATLAVPMIVRQDAEAGPQSQPYQITYLLRGESTEAAGSVTLDIERVVEEVPVMLLDAYNVDKDPLRPGAQFELSVTLKNVGAVDARAMLVTFGTVESTGSPDPDPDGEGGTGSGTGGTGGSTTNPSTTFAPLGSGGTLFIGDIAADDTYEFAQAFIVNGTTNSGIYSLPITLRYKKTDGETVQDNLRASVVVVKPPTLRINLISPPPESVNVGEPVTLTYDLINTGSAAVNLTNAVTSAANAEVVDGAETFIGAVPANDQGAYTSTFIPSQPGPVTVDVEIRYLDDLSNERSFTYQYSVEALEPPPPPDFEPTPDFIPTPTPTPESDDAWLGKLLMGLLGLGS
jgi:hypothetical protein